MLTITLTEPPSAGWATFIMRFEDENGTEERELLISNACPPFDEIDDFLYAIVSKQLVELNIDEEGVDWYFRTLSYNDNWNVTLKIHHDTTGRSWLKRYQREEKDIIITVPTYNLLYEFGKILAVRNWLLNPYILDPQQEELYKHSWKEHHHLSGR